MRVLDKRPKVSRRGFLGGSGVTLVAMSILPSGVILGADSAWAMTAKALKPESFATLVQMSRDIYPHDRLNDSYYAKAVAAFDSQAEGSEDSKKMLEDGVAALDAAAMKAHGVTYGQVGWEAERVALLQAIESDGFFQSVRGGLVTGIYNNPDVWPLFGYEGASADQGGYIERGFDDIDWLEA